MTIYSRRINDQSKTSSKSWTDIHRYTFNDEPQCTVAGGVCLHQDNPYHGKCLSKNGGVCVNADECLNGKIVDDKNLCKKNQKFCCVYNDENEA
ncbi:hypothetical protein Anas_03600 [Armadillidium nasatum]|uniref:Uncharacterized protein n=1 Tax=Armadillidium nasatum TaxID=96803 RepID=A0A5N5SSN1_9CRUS|nr:hypothetical protein Anas_03600 [Armadillidium nasatum]